MATITLLHWNIDQFSNEKLNNANGQALIDYIAAVVAHSGAQIVSLMGLKNSAVNNILSQLIPAINLAKQQGPPLPNRWNSVTINSQKDNEAYVVLHQSQHGFSWLLPRGANTTSPINNLTSQKIMDNGAPGGSLRFNSNLTPSGGRTPYYVAFKTETSKAFTIVAYHTMAGQLAKIGVNNTGLLAQLKVIDDTGTTVQLAASMTCGDFNVDFNQSRIEYANLTKAASYSTDEKTTLVDTPPPAGSQPDQYRLNAYDNIFRYKTQLPPTNEGIVMDLIKDSTTIEGGGTGQFASQAGAFVRSAIDDGELIQNIPPKNFQDAWRIVRHAISNHLPVYVTMDI